jgi:hypothetical protein
MSSHWTIPLPREVAQRAREVRNGWSDSERQARRTQLPPDSSLRNGPLRLWLVTQFGERCILPRRPRMA